MWRSSLLVVAAVGAAHAGPGLGSPGPASSVLASGSGTIAGRVEIAKLSVGSQVAGMADVVVYLEDAPMLGAAEQTHYVVVQQDKTFRPRVTVVAKGATVEFPNRDQFFHNVFSIASASKFDLGLYKGGESKSVVFDKPGIVPVFCNIHPQMLAFVVVVPNRFWTRPGDDGKFTLKDVPPGTYTAVAWFPNGNLEREQVKVDAGRRIDASFVLRERSGMGRHANKDGKPYTRY